MSQHAFELLAQGQAIPLANGATLSREQFPMLQPATPGGPIAQVSANPQNPAQVGMQNLTNSAWTARMPDGTQHSINPGQAVGLIEGVSLQLGALNCSIRAVAGAGVGQSFSQPPISQPQQPYAQPQESYAQPQQPYYQQAAPPQTPGTWPPAPNPYAGGGGGFNNDSGTGAAAVLPPELKGFNGGAFLLNWIWAVNMKTYLGLLCLIPYLGFIMAIVLGVKGNEWAWQNRRWASVEEFKACQKVWQNWGLGFFVASIVIWVAAVLVQGMAGRH